MVIPFNVLALIFLQMLANVLKEGQCPVFWGINGVFLKGVHYYEWWTIESRCILVFFLRGEIVYQIITLEASVVLIAEKKV